MSVRKNNQTQNRRSARDKCVITTCENKNGQKTAFDAAGKDTTSCGVKGCLSSAFSGSVGRVYPSDTGQVDKGHAEGAALGVVLPCSTAAQESMTEVIGESCASLPPTSSVGGAEVLEDSRVERHSEGSRGPLGLWEQTQSDSEAGDDTASRGQEGMTLSHGAENFVAQQCSATESTKNDKGTTVFGAGVHPQTPFANHPSGAPPRAGANKTALQTKGCELASRAPPLGGKCKGQSNRSGERATHSATDEPMQCAKTQALIGEMRHGWPAAGRGRAKPLPVGETYAPVSGEGEMKNTIPEECSGHPSFLPRSAGDGAKQAQQFDSASFAARQDDLYNCHYGSHVSTAEVSLALSHLVDSNVIAPLAKNVEEMVPHRRMQLSRLAGYLNEAINNVAWRKGVRYGEKRYYIFGSLASGTVLPDGDNDMTIEVDGMLNPARIEAQSDAHADSSDGTAGSSCSSSVSGRSSQATTVAGGELLSSVADYLRENNKSVYVDSVVIAEVRVLKLVMDGSSYDITVGQLGGVSCIRFLHEMDMRIGCNHLLKRTLLLMKAWCCYEAHVLSGQGGYISSYAATVMIISMINTIEFLEDVQSDEGEEQASGKHRREHRHDEYKHISPLQLFARFLKYFSYFDFENYCLTLFGPVPCDEINNVPLDLCLVEPHMELLAQNNGSNKFGLTSEGQAALGHCLSRRAKQLITPQELKQMLSHESHRPQRRKAGGLSSGTQANKAVVSSSGPESPTPGTTRERPISWGAIGNEGQGPLTGCGKVNFPLRTMNVMDPLRWGSSVCRGVCRNHLQRICRAFREGLARLKACSAELAQCVPAALGAVVGLDANGPGKVAGDQQLPGGGHQHSGDAVAYNQFVDSTRQSVLHYLFGCTLHHVARYCPEPQRGKPCGTSNAM